MGDEVSPGFASGVDDGVIALEDAVREPVGAEELPDILDGVQLWSARGQKDQRHVPGDVERARGVPAGAVEQQDSVRVFGDRAGDFVEVELHRCCVGVGHGERRAGSARRTNRPEQPGALITLVGGLARPRSASCPLADDSVLLTDPGLVLEPDLDRLSLGDANQMRVQRRSEVFLNASIVRASCPGWRGRALMCEKPSALRSLPTVRSW